MKAQDTPKGYLSYSQLKAFAKSPNHYLAYLAQEFKPSAKMMLGTAVHAYLLEFDQFEARYVVQAKADRRTTAGKELAAQQEAELNGRTAITVDEFGLIRQIADAVNANEFARDVIANSERELVAQDIIYGHEFKAVADIFNGSLVADLKTCDDASPDGFMRQAHSLDYHLQAAIYRELFGVQNFYWIAAETSAPFNVQVYCQSQAAAVYGSNRLGLLLEKFSAWDGNPQGYHNDVMELNLPRWA